MELDENAVSRAAHLMVATLAGSLAHVTCKVSCLYSFPILNLPCTPVSFLFNLVNSILISLPHFGDNP